MPQNWSRRLAGQGLVEYALVLVLVVIIVIVVLYLVGEKVPASASLLALMGAG